MVCHLLLWIPASELVEVPRELPNLPASDKGMKLVEEPIDHRV
ncbi:MAG: hypothetical protein ACLFSV_14015 [Alkalispirochaeta sp.]